VGKARRDASLHLVALDGEVISSDGLGGGGGGGGGGGTVFFHYLSELCVCVCVCVSSWNHVVQELCLLYICLQRGNCPFPPSIPPSLAPPLHPSLRPPPPHLYMCFSIFSVFPPILMFNLRRFSYFLHKQLQTSLLYTNIPFKHNNIKLV